mmetsp:Transcript_27281/g.35335  ORF Transcript_27281/g.35335 Transcript_27281/m.35335 type:complete len:113 (+) Transcript_27281:434-772(+)
MIFRHISRILFNGFERCEAKMIDLFFEKNENDPEQMENEKLLCGEYTSVECCTPCASHSGGCSKHMDLMTCSPKNTLERSGSKQLDTSAPCCQRSSYITSSSSLGIHHHKRH